MRAAEALRIEEGDPTSRLNAKVEGRSVVMIVIMKDRMMAICRSADLGEMLKARSRVLAGSQGNESCRRIFLTL